MDSPPVAAMMAVGMMVAMMLPSFAPAPFRYHRALRAGCVSHAFARTILFTAAYIVVWTAVGLLLFVVDRQASMTSAPLSARPGLVAAILLAAGAVQQTPWKARRLARCRELCVDVERLGRPMRADWAHGFRVGIDCVLNCAGLMAVLLVTGLMDMRVMVAITAAIAVERHAPQRLHIARVTGAVALIAGVMMCAR